ncbi:hypothetical protein A2630_00300 [Candidatus Woesebacteria bacterium RIFCSPHIGHO2_01_FULL_44_10]|uniref:Uncharacterized protein n=1 Tax=Candidatus Woesebacteria bacterium RIFCSPLOWO2_01_FULL_44_14 TaxID=1802525 RepID=A0A1F8BXB3_9BACT|nr:MAG: hypothetical protein A2630_00300 [Candidatus Woesebacteria bacterium RIFCSPHIGHO2_01_FULL_44_10]OGM55794.1 MAG: hypothetical protein A3F62_04185 [Candidatus Woesebacteria bacterium RIFCSPHIGHO2_12_FULL_44_11]OGM68744.1 MAG: hypothetical protein A2975_05600 [Candidatus Woesebacteria bacterium RIFCSPLOWO2_01_FULL_44_14]
MSEDVITRRTALKTFGFALGSILASPKESVKSLQRASDWKLASQKQKKWQEFQKSEEFRKLNIEHGTRGAEFDFGQYGYAEAEGARYFDGAPVRHDVNFFFSSVTFDEETQQWNPNPEFLAGFVYGYREEEGQGLKNYFTGEEFLADSRTLFIHGQRWIDGLGWIRLVPETENRQNASQIKIYTSYNTVGREEPIEFIVAESTRIPLTLEATYIKNSGRRTMQNPAGHYYLISCWPFNEEGPNTRERQVYSLRKVN